MNRMSSKKADLNQLVRNLLNDYYVKAMKPNLKIVAEQIGVSHSFLVRFKTGTDISEKSLNKIFEYLQKQQKQIS